SSISFAHLRMRPQLRSESQNTRPDELKLLERSSACETLRFPVTPGYAQSQCCVDFSGELLSDPKTCQWRYRKPLTDQFQPDPRGRSGLFSLQVVKQTNGQGKRSRSLSRESTNVCSPLGIRYQQDIPYLLKNCLQT